MAEVSIDFIFDLIRSCSYPRNKAKYLSGMAKMLVNDFNANIPSDLDDLQKLPGVGRKTANVVRSVCFDIPAMPVDTHIYRVSKRLGFIGNVSNEIAHKELERIIPENDRYDMHIQLITHGRNICKSQKPLCNQCNLRNLGCP